MSFLDAAPSSNPTAVTLSDESRRIIVTDIDMGIGEMCRFMVKWAIAAVPAAFILGAIVGLIIFALTAAGLFHPS